jgi:hypothetical protein
MDCTMDCVDHCQLRYVINIDCIGLGEVSPLPMHVIILPLSLLFAQDLGVGTVSMQRGTSIKLGGANSNSNIMHLPFAASTIMASDDSEILHDDGWAQT